MSSDLLVEIRPDHGVNYVMDHVIRRLLSESVELHIRETERRRQCPAGAPLAWPPLASCESGGIRVSDAVKSPCSVKNVLIICSDPLKT